MVTAETSLTVMRGLSVDRPRLDQEQLGSLVTRPDVELGLLDDLGCAALIEFSGIRIRGHMRRAVDPAWGESPARTE